MRLNEPPPTRTSRTEPSRITASITRYEAGMLGLRRYGNGQLSVAGAIRVPCQKLAQCGTGPPGVTVRTAGCRPGRLPPLSSAQGVRWNTSSIVVAYLSNTNGAYQLYIANVPPGARCARAAAIDCSVSR